MEPNVNGIFISEKTNKIRWRPDAFNNCHSFITASWDNKVNSVKLWDFVEKVDDPDIYPFMIGEHKIRGDITEAKFLDSDFCVLSTSLGSAILLKLSADTREGEAIIESVTEWNGLHHFSNNEVSSCTSLAVYDNNIATIGEDGRVNLLSRYNKEVVRTIDEADSCSLNCAIFLKHDELLTANSRGQMKLWDLRSKEDTPSATFLLSTDNIMPTCTVHHPTNRHMLVVGDEDGSLTVWDLRNNAYPVNVLEAHGEPVSEIQFHPEYSNQLFSCSFSGAVWQWTGYSKDGVDGGVAGGSSSGGGDGGLWFLADGMRNLEVLALIPQLHKPVNSLDLNRDKVICGCDNEAIYVINNICLYNI